MSTLIQFHIDARLSGDTVALASKLEGMFRLEVTGGDGDLDSTSVVPAKRGGRISMTVTVDLEPDDAIAAIKAVGERIDTTPNLIERIDQYRLAASRKGKFLGFVQGDFRGWVRAAILDELAEARS